MSLAFRLIARLDIRNQSLIKTRQLEGVRRLGDPAEYAERYDAQGIDEIYYNDAVASLYGRNHLGEIVAATSYAVFCPLLVGGGVRDIGAVRELLNSGADQVAVNTAAVGRPDLIDELARKFGSQCVIIQIDARRKGNSWEAYCDGGRQATGRDALAWAQEAVERGAGEVLFTSIDFEGTGQGPDLEAAEAFASVLPVPVVYGGGIGSADHVVQLARRGVSGVAMAGVLHFGKVSLEEIRCSLGQSGFIVRPAA